MSNSWWTQPGWHVFNDIYFVVHVRIDPEYNTLCHVLVYESVGHFDSGEPMMIDAKGERVDNPTTLYLRGSVKWDGCSNWHFNEQDRNMLHFCSVKDAANIGELFRRIYAICLELFGENALDDREFVEEEKNGQS